jgi:RNA polymerase sigma-70 factor (ECF subfamily)
MWTAPWHRQVAPLTSDAELCRAAAAGSDDALSALYDRHSAFIYRFALRVSQNASIAEEVTQDVFLTLLKNSAQFDPSRGKLSTWFCAIARRMVWKHLERSGRLAALAEGDDTQTCSDDPHVALTRKETITAVRQGLENLPEQLREVIVLCEFEEMNYQEVASVLDVPIGTVRSRLHRAKARLAEILGSMPAASEKENCK